MITVEQIYNATNNGLDIILYYYPQARDSVNTRKPFALRNERTPSTYIKQMGNVWKVTDFGDDQHARSPIDICMREESRTFNEAILILAERYRVEGTRISAKVNRPDIRQRPPTPEETEGSFFFECNDGFTDAEMKIFGANVKEDHLTNLGYRSVKWTSRTKKNDKGEIVTTVTGSNENYPVFVRVCKVEGKEPFYKFYQPLNYDKAFRFYYHGSKPKDYVNGLAELKKMYDDYNAKERQIWESYPANEGKTYKEKKIDAVVICSGERDAVNCKAYGYCPVWFNSETATLEPGEYKAMKKYAEVIYNIPDIDKTGKRKGIELGMKYIDIRTAKLPEWLKTYKDMRGNPRKDLRDFLELRPLRYEFENLLKRAFPYEFWETRINKDGNQSLEINSKYMLNFLADSGFGKLQDKETKKETFIRVKNNVVTEITAKDVRAYLVSFADEKTTNVNVHNLILNSSRAKTQMMDDLPVLDIDFTDNDKDRQFLFFKNRTLEITGTAIKEHIPKDCDQFVLENKVSEHSFKRIEPAFIIKEKDGGFSEGYDFFIKNTQSHYFRYLINTCREYWRLELEERKTGDQNIDDKYFSENQFNIQGSRLSPDEIADQVRLLVSKLYAIGYIMHRYKDKSKSWLLWVMETIRAEDGVSSGGSGKSFLIDFIEKFKRTINLGGRNKKLTENQHIFENVDENTDLIRIDDADNYFDFNFFYDKITGSLTVNEKHVKSKEISYKKSPKLIVTSNFPPRAKDPSTMRRLLFVLHSDWYHKANDDNGYNETRRIYDDFGYEICEDGYKEEFWNEDINFLCDCLQFYLRVAHTEFNFQPKLNRVFERINISIMGDQFQEWAEVYFDKDSENVNKLIPRIDAFAAFNMDSGVKNWTSKQFGKALKAYCANASYIQELNPAELRNSDKRIISKLNGKAVEMIYIQTVGIEVNKNPF